MELKFWISDGSEAVCGGRWKLVVAHQHRLEDREFSENLRIALNKWFMIKNIALNQWRQGREQEREKAQLGQVYAHRERVHLSGNNQMIHHRLEYSQDAGGAFARERNSEPTHTAFFCWTESVRLEFLLVRAIGTRIFQNTKNAIISEFFLFRNLSFRAIVIVAEIDVSLLDVCSKIASDSEPQDAR